MQSIIWDNKILKILDQTKVPFEENYLSCDNYTDVMEAIKKLQVRGAPAIGVAAAFAMVLASRQSVSTNKKLFLKELFVVGESLKSTRPTAVNLFWAVDRMYQFAEKSADVSINKLVDSLEKEARLIYKEDLEQNKMIGKYGLDIFTGKVSILTHCNAGALATVGYGTALGVIRAAYAKDKVKQVFASETRPLLQGARLTAWELQKDNIPVTVITDNMSGYLMGRKFIDMIIVGADRIVANGDVANKIGTYSIAILAAYHKIPFYVAAPRSTIDLFTETGEKIIIEERAGSEVRNFNGIPVFSEEIAVLNPAFDVTPAKLITGIITDRGILYPPFKKSIARIFDL